MQEVGLYEHRHPRWGRRASLGMVDLGQVEKKEANLVVVFLRAGVCNFNNRI
jgi:hypothetical protein